MTDPILALAPDACTLPTAEQPLRLAEFDQLLTDHLRGQERPSSTRLRWLLDPGSEAIARDLCARESSCCSFFGFTFSPAADTFVVDIDVPAAQVEVLDALQALAARGAAS